MPWLTQLADVARRTGYPVTELPGWQERGHGPQPSVQGIVCHHTAGPAGGGDAPSLAVVRDGRQDLKGPLSHFVLGRSGRIYVVAAGRCWHNAPATSTQHTNHASIGIEAENDGEQAWPPVQLDAYRRLCAELCKAFGLTAAAVVAHREVNRSKPDPHSIDMRSFRAAIARLITQGEVMTGEAVFQAVWFTDAVPVPWGTEQNPQWQARSVLVDHGVKLREVLTRLDQMETALGEVREIVTALDSRVQDLDVEGVVGRLQEVLDRVTVRLETTTG